MSRLAPRITSAAARQQLTAFWSLATTVLSSVLFVLVGLQAQTAVRNLSSVSAGRAVGYIFAITGVVIGMRWAWTYTMPYLLPSRRSPTRTAAASGRCAATDGQRHHRIPGRGVAGGRAGRPQSLDSGAPFPDRDLIIVITSGVIVLTPAAGAVAAHGRSLRPAAGRHLGRRGATPGRADHR